MNDQSKLHQTNINERNKKVLLIVNDKCFIKSGKNDFFLKHFPKRIPSWIDYDFEITDLIINRKSSEYDYIIFYGDHHYSPNNYQPTLFLNDISRIKYRRILYGGIESKTVIDYNYTHGKLLKEWPYHDFEVFILQKDLIHPKSHPVPFLLVPHYLMLWDISNILDYDFFTNNSPKKEKLLTIVSSNFTHATHHQARIEFTHKIKEHFQDKIDFYGRGFNDFDNKYHTLSPYKYQIVIENGVEEGYWTEKLRDCYIAECYPLYFGCPNVTDFFDKESLTIIDINDFDSAVKTINMAIEDNYFEKRYSKIKEAKALCLNEYSFFNTLRNYCLELEKIYE